MTERLTAADYQRLVDQLASARGITPIEVLTGLRQAAEQVERLEWKPIASAPHDEFVLVALVRDGIIRRVSEAKFNGLGWYDKGGGACHWRTHWLPLPSAILDAPDLSVSAAARSADE